MCVPVVHKSWPRGFERYPETRGAVQGAMPSSRDRATWHVSDKPSYVDRVGHVAERRVGQSEQAPTGFIEGHRLSTTERQGRDPVLGTAFYRGRLGVDDQRR